MANLPVKAAFSPSVLSNLRATAGMAGEPLNLPLTKIEEDPDQPRKDFDAEKLEQLAETIRLCGVIVPIGVRKLEGDRYRLVHGARRVRASHLAGLTSIPATVLPEGKCGLAIQVIENQARSNLSNRDLATAVNTLFASGMKVKQIAAVCGLKEYLIAAFRSVEKLPMMLADRLDHADMRAIYDLYRAWEAYGPAIEKAMPAPDVYLTVTEARRILEAMTGKDSGSVFLARDRRQEPSPPEPTAALPSEPEANGPEPAEADLEPATSTKVKPRRAAADAPQPPAPMPAHKRPRFVMETADGRQGVLVTERRARVAGNVLLDIGDEPSVEVAVRDLRPIDVG